MNFVDEFVWMAIATEVYECLFTDAFADGTEYINTLIHIVWAVVHFNHLGSLLTVHVAACL